MNKEVQRVEGAYSSYWGIYIMNKEVQRVEGAYWGICVMNKEVQGVEGTVIITYQSVLYFGSLFLMVFQQQMKLLACFKSRSHCRHSKQHWMTCWVMSKITSISSVALRTCWSLRPDCRTSKSIRLMRTPKTCWLKSEKSDHLLGQIQETLCHINDPFKIT